MPRTLSDLYVSRCVKNASGKFVPHFWSPQPMARKALCKFGDETKTFDAETEAGVLGVMQRLIALGRSLELPVGQMVLAQTKKDYPDQPFVKELLTSAVADEARHDLGFKYAEEAYGLPCVEDLAESEALRVTWVKLAEKYEPLSVAAAMEQETFLVTLGIMRLVGGASLNELALQVAKDESRHVATNRAVASWLGVTFDKDVEQAVDATLAFAMKDFSTKVSPSLRVDYDFCIASSRELRETGTAAKLDKFTRIAQAKMPFELCNRSLYTARQTESGETVY